MTIFLRALWGPIGPHSDAWVGASGQQYAATIVDWFFFGIREDQSMGRWSARIELRSRKWKSINWPMNDLVKGMTLHPPHPDFIDAYIPDAPMIYGRTYIDILRARLRPSDIAYATRLAIEAAR